jgi:hypothetical protein
MIVELDGVEHDFPNDATQDQIRQALSSYSGATNSTISSWPSTYMQMVEDGKEGCGANGLAAGHWGRPPIQHKSLIAWRSPCHGVLRRKYLCGDRLSRRKTEARAT